MRVFMPILRFKSTGRSSIFALALFGFLVAGAVERASCQGLALELPPCDELPEGIVGWWPGEGSAENMTRISDGLARNVEYVPGLVGQAFKFSGEDSSVRVPTSSELRSFRNISMECWVWNDPQKPFRRLMTLTPDWIRLELDDDRPSFRVSLTGGELVSAVADERLSPNAWHHLVGTYDGKAARVWVDGALAKESIAETPIPLSNDGAASEIYLNFIQAGEIGGLIDEPIVYDYALSQGQILKHFDAQGSGICFRESIPVNIADSAGFLGIRRDSGFLELTTQTVIGVTYQIQRSRGLIEWEDDGEAFAGTGKPVVSQREKFETTRFWRAVVVPQ